MPTFTYDDSVAAVRENLREAHRQTWKRIAAPGTWWSGAERVEIARTVRAARGKRSDPPWQRREAAAESSELPRAAIEVARRVAIDAHRLERSWSEAMISQLGQAPYV